MPTITEQELKTQMSGGALASLYLLKGKEKLLVKRAAKKLIRLASGDVFPEFNRNEFPGEAAVEQIADAAAALPFMAEHKCVVVSDFNAEERPQAELEQLLDLLDDLPETTTLVLYFPTLNPGGSSGKWKKLLDRAGKRGFVVDFPQREAADLRQILGKTAERQGCQLSRPALNRLIEYVGSDLTQLLGEVEKLCAYTLGQGGREITLETVEEMTPKSTEATVFVMMDALLAGDAQRAYTILDSLLFQNAEPVKILGAMVTPYLDMVRVKGAMESGLPTDAPLEYAPEYKPGRDKKINFRLRKAQQNLRHFNTQTLKACLDLLLEADGALKGSQLDKSLVLERLAAQLMLTQRGER